MRDASKRQREISAVCSHSHITENSIIPVPMGAPQTFIGAPPLLTTTEMDSGIFAQVISHH